MLLKKPEKLLNDKGWKITYKSDLCITFEKNIEKFNYVHGVDIVHKQTGKHIIQSYQKNSSIGEFDYMVGLSFEELKLFMKYFKKLRW